MTSRAETLRSDLRQMTADGVFFSVMVGLGEAYIPAFALALGQGAAAAGLVATLPLLAGACFQLVTPVAVRRLRSYRRWVVACACLQGLCFLPFAASALAAWGPLAWLLAVASAYWGFGMATSPAWNAWVTTLVPAKLRVRFFARRSRSAQAALLCSLLASGALLELARNRGHELGAFASMFVLAACARVLSARCLARQSEDPRAAEAHRALPLRSLPASLRGTGGVRVLVYLLCMQLAAQIAAPYFTPYMLGPLGLGYERFTALIAASFLARIAILPALGRLAQHRGSRFILIAGAIGIVPLPTLWLVSHHFGYLLALQLVSGCAWAAVEYASLLSFFEGIEERDRASVLSYFNLANAAAVAAGSLLGGALLRGLGAGESAYPWLFVASALARLAILPLLGRSGATRATPKPVPLRATTPAGSELAQRERATAR
ncbi:MAG TPA: MFS transporter [Myxococcota bacterium]|nr:MFS transporter [Myxococcota bacterium]